MTPVADEDGLVWLRRVSFDLVGLPPTAEHFAAIEKDASQKTREKIVDELLASKAFGERWGRHWLDVARFAESTGKERNFPYPAAWKYRDWVIDAVNADKPYDQFVREQVAGDLLPAQTSAEKDANVIATGFLALGPKGLNERNRESYLLDIADEQIENVSRTVMGLSVACARCHDHKFDPVSMADYYALAGIFRSTEVKSGIQNRTRNAGQPNWLAVLPSKAATYEELVPKELLAEIKLLEKEARVDAHRTRTTSRPGWSARNGGTARLIHEPSSCLHVSCIAPLGGCCQRRAEEFERDRDEQPQRHGWQPGGLGVFPRFRIDLSGGSSVSSRPTDPIRDTLPFR